MKRNYPIEHQKQIRKYWKNLSPKEREDLIKDNVEEYFEESKLAQRNVNREEKRRNKLFNLVVGLNPENEIVQYKNLRTVALEFYHNIDETSFIDSILFPSLDQVASIPRFALHQVGKIIYKIINDINFSKLFVQLEQKNKPNPSETGSIVSKKKSSKKQSSHKGTEKSNQANNNAKEVKDDAILTPIQNRIKSSKLQQSNFNQEYQNVCQELAGGGSEWMTIEKGKAPNIQKKRRSNDKSNYSGKNGGDNNAGQPTELSKAYSLRDHEPEPFDLRRANSNSINVNDDVITQSNNLTLSTKTESRVVRSNEVNNIYSKPETAARHEDEMSNETISQRSNRGSVDRMQNTSVDRMDKNFRTNSNELNVRIKNNNHNKVFKQLQKVEIPLKSNMGASNNKDRKEGKLQIVNLYSEQSIMDIMSNGNNRNQRQRATKKNNPLTTEVESMKHIGNGEKRIPSIQLKQEETTSPLATKKNEKKVIYSTVVTKLSKWEVDDFEGQADESNSQSHTLAFGEHQQAGGMIDIPKKVDLKKGFQKYLSGPMSLEQGELFFKNYLNYSINDSVSKIKTYVNSQEPLRIAAFKRIRHIMTQSFKTIKSSLQIYGSWVTGLMIESSDIDLCIKRFEVLDRNDLRTILETLENNLKVFKWVKEIKGIYTATVPVLKLVGWAETERRSKDRLQSNSRWCRSLRRVPRSLPHEDRRRPQEPYIHRRLQGDLRGYNS